MTWNFKLFIRNTFLLSFLFCMLSQTVYAEKWWDDDAKKRPIRRKEAPIAKKAYEAFAEGNFNEALKLLNRLTVSPDRRTSLKTMKRIWQKRKRLGNIHPKFTYKAMVFNIKSMDIVTHSGKHIKSSLSKEENDQIRLYAKMTQKTYEAFSNGEMTLTFDFMDFDGPMTGLTYTGSDKMQMPRHDSVPGLTKALMEKSKDYDLIVIHWPRGFHGTALGGEWAVPYIESVTYGPRRGRLILNAMHGYGIWVHEAFHSLEGHAHISPIHGYYSEPRVHFPDWKGVSGDQFDYFDWQFQTSIKKLGYEKLLFRKLYQQATPENVQAEALRRYANISMANRYEADKLVATAKRERDLSKKEALLKKAIRLSPYISHGHIELAKMYARLGEYDKAIRSYNIVLKYFPRPSQYRDKGRLQMKDDKIDAALQTFLACEKTPAGDGIEEIRRTECIHDIGLIYGNKKKDKQKGFEYMYRAIDLGLDTFGSRQSLHNFIPANVSATEVAHKLHKTMGDTGKYADLLAVLQDKENDDNAKLKLLLEAEALLKKLRAQNPDYKYTDYISGNCHYALALYYKRHNNQAKMYENARQFIMEGKQYLRNLDLFVESLPKNMTEKQLRRFLATYVKEDSKIDYAIKAFRKKNN